VPTEATNEAEISREGPDGVNVKIDDIAESEPSLLVSVYVINVQGQLEVNGVREAVEKVLWML
jgi:hypothetical protein